MKRGIAIVLSVMMAFSGVSGYIPAATAHAASTGLLKDADFEDSDSSCWGLQSGVSSIGTFAESGNSSKCLKISASTDGYYPVMQTVTLQPNTTYKLTGWVKGVDIVAGEHCDGAAIDIEPNTGYYIGSENNFQSGTFETTVVTYFRTGTNPQVSIRCRLGHNWGNSRGTAYFDNLTLETCTYTLHTSDRVPMKVGNVQAYITKDMMSAIDPNIQIYGGLDSNYGRWVTCLNEAYEKYSDLTGSTPFYGDTLLVINSDEPWMKQFYGIGNYNPVRIQKDETEVFQRYAEKGDVGFGVLHEIGHVFDKTHEHTRTDYGWNFNSEFWANTKMLYVVDSLDDIKVMANDHMATNRQELQQYLYKVSKGGYDNYLKAGNFTEDYYDALCYVFIDIVNKIGWEPFKATFRQYTSGEVETPSTNWAKFERFMYLLQQNYNPGGNEVKSCFPQSPDMYGQIKTCLYNSQKDANDALESSRSSYLTKTDSLINGLGSDYSAEWMDPIFKEQREKIEHAGTAGEMETAYGVIEVLAGSETLITYASMQENSSSYGATVQGGKLSGTENKGIKLTKLWIKPASTQGVQVRAYIDHAWTAWGWTVDGNGKDIEAIQVKLNSTLESKYDVYYRTHNRYYGWYGWTKNGASSGTLNMSSAIEGFQVRLVPKNTVVSGITDDTKSAVRGAEATATPTNTPKPTATNTPRPTATNTPKPTATNTPRPTATNTPTPRVTVTNTPTPTDTGDSPTRIGVRYDTVGGELSQWDSYVYLTVGEALPELATAQKEGYEFLGWYTSETGGTKISHEDQNYRYDGSFTRLYAHYKPLEYRVMFDAQGGSVDSGYITVPYDSAYGTLPVPTRSGYTFKGWYTYEGEEITSESIFQRTADQYLYAQWEEGEAPTVTPTPTEKPEEIQVYYYTGKGVVIGGKSTVTMTVGQPIPPLATAYLNGYTFDGWYTDPDGGEKVEEGMIYHKGDFTTIFAHYSLEEYTVHFDANGGTVDTEEMKIHYGDSYGELPVPVKGDVEFLGWSTRRNGGIFISSGDVYNIKTNQWLYAVWDEEETTPTPTEPEITNIPTEPATGTPAPTNPAVPTATIVPDPEVTVTPTPVADKTTITIHCYQEEGVPEIFYYDVNGDEEAPAECYQMEKEGDGWYCYKFQNTKKVSFFLVLGEETSDEYKVGKGEYWYYYSLHDEYPDMSISATPTPVEEATVTPGITDEPGVTDKPEEPGITDKPGITGEPEEPGITDKPGITGEPEEPGVTDKPEISDEPGITDKPEISDTPKITDEPEISQEPEEPTPTPVKALSGNQISFTVRANGGKVHAGDKVILKAVVPQSYAPVQYCFSYTYQGKTVVLKNYSSNNTVNFQPKKDGTYSFKVQVKQEDGRTVTKSSLVKVLKKYQLTSLKVKNSGKKKKITAKIQGSEGSVKYMYQIKYKGKVIKKTSYTKKNSYTIKLTKKGTYYITVSAKDTKTNRLVRKTVKYKVR